ncbi:MAG: hypothetical protein COT88_01450 [Candidatus Colwellbacteria bacterium CG10_big_fil_rev_8_21_14_0_10_41_28]|uniref:Cell shape-determining protein MreC n=1 Tax=Candidatus Colwellbacteria bacterium CG10_big_fil_rev_8_21_14_0_10_41_28 TaxID=1974539 RepID=A0A2H0VHB6_9BACT|nr:MAG: hypothetical protein COT88_01450 [Candidatus Colwellbacteria bacterium CG10_big_fil_rev_8_21_14_0_10_41_28]
MIKPRSVIWGLTILAVVLIVVFGYRTKLSLSNGLASVTSNINPFSSLENQIKDLEAENLSLRARLLEQEVSSEDQIKVFSTYPFNNRSEIAIDGGRNIGIEVKDVVITNGNILVGIVKSVSKSTSIVTTIFDPTFETPVRLGSSQIDALAVGGNILKVDLIPKDTEVKVGDLVVSADKDLPYGLTLGTINSIDEGKEDVFKSADISPGFEIKSLRNVSIYR